MRRFFIAVLPVPLAGWMACMSVASADEKPGSAKVLEKFFELGLPDAKDGKWVRVFTMDAEDGEATLGAGRVTLSGNGWLVRENRGVVEAVMADGRVVRGRRMKDEDAEPRDEGGLQPVQIQPANLDE